ncbi:hypothetical protein KFE25_002373 [Diacronema lutheri]|uniref:peptidylprolyl isomerase n=2 Tax=Diacronema lutheri TaxID=2081491 RepID=A0A8J6C5M2_DIALT|nr:hypothetical protein KFE25_002373 [Diacronema lutheri]
MAGHVLALLFAAAAAARAPAWQQRSRVARAPARSPVSAFRMMVVMPDAAIDVQRPPKSAEATVVLTIPGEATREVFDGLVRRAKETAVVNGFKKGTAPEALVVGAVGKKRLASDAIAALLEHYCGTAVGRAVPDAIGEPKVAEDSEAIMEAFSPGKPLTLTLSVELWPQVSVSKGDYDKLHIEVEVPPFNQRAFDSTLASLQQRQARLESLPAEHVAVEGDTVLVDMTGYEQLPDGSKGGELNVASGTELTVELFPGRFMPGLVEGLLGVKAGEQRLVPVQFSSRSQQAQLAGKDLLFDVQVRAVQRKVVPDLDDAFAASIQPGLTFAQLDQKVREGVQAEVDKAVSELARNQLEAALVARLLPDTPVPDTLVTEQARKRWAQVLADTRAKQQCSDEELQAMVTPEAFEAYKAETMDDTLLVVKGALLVDAIAKVEGVVVDKAELDEQAQLVRQSDAKGMEKVDDAMLLKQIEATLLRTKVLDLVASRATIDKVPMRDDDDDDDDAAAPA